MKKTYWPLLLFMVVVAPCLVLGDMSNKQLENLIVSEAAKKVDKVQIVKTLGNPSTDTTTLSEKALRKVVASYVNYSTFPPASVDSQLVLFRGSTGRKLKAAAGSGIPKLSAGILGFAVPGTDYLIPTGNAATATALAANGTNCSAGQAALGVDASGNSEGCFVPVIPTGVAGGQTINGGTASGQNLTLSSTAHATKGKIFFGNSAYDHVNNRLGIGVVSPAETLSVSGNALVTTIGGGAYFKSSNGTTNVWFGTSSANLGFIGTITTHDLDIRTGNTPRIRIESANGNVGIGTTAPTGVLHLKAGTATVSTAPIKLTSGVNLTAPEAGAIEWDGANLFATQTTGPTRKTIAYTDSNSTGSAAKLTTPRTINGVSFDGSANIAITTAGNFSATTYATSGDYGISDTTTPNPNTGAERDYGGSLLFKSSYGFPVGRVRSVQPAGAYADSGELILSSVVDGIRIKNSGNVVLYQVPVYSDNTAAASLATGTVYRTATGQLMLKY